MERNREARRTMNMAASNGGVSRRRYRTEEDGAVELPDTARLRDRGNGKKDRDRVSSKSKRKRGDRLIPDGEDSSEESVNDEEDDDNDRMLPPPTVSSHRKSFPPSAKGFRAAPPPSWKPADEMIGVSVPRKARTASAKRCNEWWPAAAGGGMVTEGIPRQDSTSPVRLASVAASPSSLNAPPVRKKQPGAKLRAAAAAKASSSMAQDEIEIEIAEVLFGMMRQPQAPPKQEDAKSRVSSPISNSSSALPISITAPKRKRPRPVKYDDENAATLSLRNSPDQQQPTHAEIPSSNPDLVPCENGEVSELNSEPLLEKSEVKDLGISNKEELQSPGSRLEDKADDMTATESNSSTLDVENQRDDKFKIDLMAPLSLRASPERDGDINLVAVDENTEMKPLIKEEDREIIEGEIKAIAAEEQPDSEKPIVCKDTKIDLQLDLEKTSDGDGVNKIHQYGLKQPPQPGSDKAGSAPAQVSSVPLPMSLPGGWPSGLPPMGYVSPLPGVVSVDGSASPTAAMQPPNLLLPQPRPKRCATHFYIARNVLYHQQIARMNPFWPAAAGSASLYGSKHGNLSILPSADLQGSLPKSSGVNGVQDNKSQSHGTFSGHIGKDRGSQVGNAVDAAQRKQILFQQALPPGGGASNIMHGPALFLPLSQQQQAGVAPSVRPVSVKSPPSGSANGSVTSNASHSASVSTSAAAAIAAAPAMSFNYSGMPGNEPQYLAILQNNGYTYPIPAHVGASPAYRGTHTHSMPFFNGSFYSSQILHSSQLQPQQQQQPPPQSHPNQQGLQNAYTAANGSFQKNSSNQQQQQQKPHGSTVSGNFPGFPASRNQPSQSQQPQQQQNHASHHMRQLESEIGGEDSPSTADSRMMSVYGPNFSMPMHTPNFALMTPASMAASGGATNDKKHRPPQGSKGLEQSQTIALPAGFDLSSLPPNHPIFQSFPEITRQGYHQIIAAAAAAQVAQQKKNYRVAEEGKTTHSSVADDDRKNMSVKAPPTAGQSIAFSRTDLAETSLSTAPAGAAVVDSSSRTLNLGSTARAPSSVMPSAMSSVNMNMCGSQHQQQQQQIIQLQKQHQYAAAVARSKTSATSNGSGYADHPPASSMAAKFPNALSSFSQNLVQSNSNSPAQSPQWKNSVRTTASSQVPTPSPSSSNTSSIKNLPQQQSRPQQNHSQISFAANQKSTTQPQVQQPASSNQSPSHRMIGSPTNSSISKGAGGSPRTTNSSSMGQKMGQSSQQTKNPTSMLPQKSSPVGGRNVTSILGNNQMTSSSSGTKLSQQSQSQQQPQQQHLGKQSLQHAQLLFPYMQGQVPHSSSSATASPSSARYYLPRRRPNGHTGVAPITIGGITTTDPATAIAAAAAEVAAINARNLNVVRTPSAQANNRHPAQFTAAQSSSNSHQLEPAGFSYVHTAAVQVKSTEQKQPAGG